MANWEELPQELLKLIAQRLAIEDFVAFGAVCTSWLSATTKETYDAKSKAPWLVTNVYKQMPEFCSPSRGRIYPVKSPGTRAQTLSLRGWMLLSNWDHEYRIFNPVSRVSIELPAMEQLFSKSFIGLKPLRVTIKLPAMEHIFTKSFIGLKPLRVTIKLPAMEQIFRESFLSLEQQGQRIDKIALSSSPSLSRSYAVMIAYRFAFGVPWLALHRSGEDAWRGVSPATHLQPIEVLQLIYYDGLYVALDAENHITTLNERESHMESRLVLGQKFEGRPYLVECWGSLLVAWETWGAEGIRFRVFEVDLEKGTQEEVESLGKASLFLNDNSSFSMEFDATSRVPGFKPNHVYFTDYADEKKKKIYSMENGKVETYSDATGLRHAGQWFQPDF